MVLQLRAKNYYQPSYPSKAFSKVILRHKRFVWSFVLHGFKLTRKIHQKIYLWVYAPTRLRSFIVLSKKVWKTSSHLGFLVLHQILFQPNFETQQVSNQSSFKTNILTKKCCPQVKQHYVNLRANVHITDISKGTKEHKISYFLPNITPVLLLSFTLLFDIWSLNAVDNDSYVRYFLTTCITF